MIHVLYKFYWAWLCLGGGGGSVPCEGFMLKEEKKVVAWNLGVRQGGVYQLTGLVEFWVGWC